MRFRLFVKIAGGMDTGVLSPSSFLAVGDSVSAFIHFTLSTLMP